MRVVNISPSAVGLQLARITKAEELILCEAVRFIGGRAAVDTTLRRASISGRVELEGEIQNHFADILDHKGNIVGTVALDAKSYSALKSRWMRCKVEKTERT